jgi:hypothetical protein
LEDGMAADELRTLLNRVIDLLEPIADHYQDEFDRRKGVRAQALRDAVRRLLSTPAREKAWRLADGSRNQTAIAREARLDRGDTSRLFKELKAIGAVSGDPQPARTVELLGE